MIVHLFVGTLLLAAGAAISHDEAYGSDWSHAYTPFSAHSTQNEFPASLPPTKTGQLVIDSSETLYGGGGGGGAGVLGELDRAGAQVRAGFYRTGACDAGSDCLPLAECTYGMQYQAARGCLSGDRSMSCGSSGGEPFVCCPRGKFESVQACGKSLVSGQFYKGLGTFPFVARIGFKSECVCVCALMLFSY